MHNFRNCAQPGAPINGDMVKTLKEMGIQLGECYAQKNCLEDSKANEIENLKKQLQKSQSDHQTDVKKLQDSLSDLQVYLQQLSKEIAKLVISNDCTYFSYLFRPDLNHVKTQHKEELRIYKVRWWHGDIIKCFPRPMEWVSVCFNFNNISAVLVTGGVPTNSVGTSVELLSSNGTRLCSLPNLPAPRHYHSQTALLSCGGGGSHSGERKSCVTFTGGHWKKTHTLGQHNQYRY